MLLTDRQTDKQTNSGENITSLAEVTILVLCANRNSVSPPLSSEGRLLKKDVRKADSLTPSSGQSPMLCPAALDIRNR